ncbi:MAG: hypothetical protein ABI672_19410, partial [Vicinamibacteria bacterium]
MPDGLLKFFSTPDGGRDAEQIRGRLLSRVLNVYMAAALAIVAFLPSDTRVRKVIALVALSEAGLCLLMRFLMHAGRGRIASWIFLLILALTVPFVSDFTTNSVAEVSVTVFQMLVIVMA